MKRNRLLKKNVSTRPFYGMSETQRLRYATEACRQHFARACEVVATLS